MTCAGCGKPLEVDEAALQAGDMARAAASLLCACPSASLDGPDDEKTDPEIAWAHEG